MAKQDDTIGQFTDTKDNNTNPLINGESAEDKDENPSLDSLFRKLRGCGRFQIVFVSLGYSPLLPAIWSLLFMIYGNYNPGLDCGDFVNDTAVPDYAENVTQTGQPGRANTSTRTVALCTCDWIKSQKNWTFSKAASTVVTEWGLVCDESWKSSSIISVQMAGVFLGSCVAGQIGDRFGRKFSVHGGAAMLAVTNVVAIFSTSWVMYAVFRFIIGFAVGCMVSTVAIYCMEFVPSFWRVFLGTFPFWSIAKLLLGLCVMALKDWRQIHMATAFLAVLAFLPVFWLPESMRYLTVHGHLKRANKTVKTIAKLNRRPLPDTSVMTTIAEREKNALKERSSYTYLDLFHRSIRKYTILLGLMWFLFSATNNSIMFGLKAFPGDFFVNLLALGAMPMPARGLNIIVASKLGRKTAVVLSSCLSMIGAVLVVVIQLAAPTDVKGIATTALVLVTNMFTEAAWASCLVLTAELFPTDIRNMPISYCSCLARIGAIVSPYLISRQSLPMWSVFVIMAIFQLTAFLSVLSLPETKGRPLQENLQVKAKKDEDPAVNGKV